MIEFVAIAVGVFAPPLVSLLGRQPAPRRARRPVLRRLPPQPLEQLIERLKPELAP